MPTEIRDLLTRQLHLELSASQSYLALSIWCDAHHLGGLAGFFRTQADEERAHALKLLDHLLARGFSPRLSGTDAPTTDFETPLDAVKHALATERANTAAIHEAYAKALELKDYASVPTLMWFIDEQVEEENWAEDLVERVRLAGCAGAVNMLDHRVSKRSVTPTVTENRIPS